MEPVATGLTGVSIDTNVVSLIVSRSEQAIPYRELLAHFRPVVTFFVQAEIQAHDWHQAQQRRLSVFLGRSQFLPPPSTDSIDDFVTLKRTSVALDLSYGTEREDLWMLAQSRSLGLPVMTHDRNAARVAQAAGMQVVTALSQIEENYARDQRRLV